MIKGIYYNSPIGRLWIEEENGEICAITKTDNIFPEQPSTFLYAVRNELEEYFCGNRKAFSFPVCPSGTKFQLKVWQALSQIPYGTVKSYKEIAENIGNPLAYRAVGNACNKNPILLAIPCHRVVGSNHALTGFALGIEIKKELLNLERINLKTL